MYECAINITAVKLSHDDNKRNKLSVIHVKAMGQESNSYHVLNVRQTRYMRYKIYQ